MRSWWWAYALVLVLTFSATYLLFDRSLPPDRPLAVSDVAAQPSLTENLDPPATDKDEARLQDVDSNPAALKQDQLPAAQKEVRLEDAPRPAALKPSSPGDAKQDLSWLAFYRLAGLAPGSLSRQTSFSAKNSPAVPRLGHPSKKSGGCQTYWGWTPPS